MTKKRLIVHIGTHKTGTTTIQALLAKNRAELREEGFCYPDTARPPFPQHPKHNSLFTSLISGDDAFETERGELMREFENSGCHTLVLSAEGLSSPRCTEFGKMQRFCEDFEIETICYLRRQDSFVESLWNQYGKRGSEKNHIDAFVLQRRILRHMTYMRTLGVWSEFSRVKALSFDAASKTGLVQSFSEITGIPLEDDTGRKRNASPSMTCVAIMVQLNKAGLSHDWRKIEKALGNDTRRHALGWRLRRELLERFAEHNERLREVYGVRFSDTMPNEPEEPIAIPSLDVIERFSSPEFQPQPAG